MKSIQEVIQNLGIQAENKGASTGAVWFNTTGAAIESYSPVDGKLIAKINQGTADDYEKIMQTASAAYLKWRKIPAPLRGEVVRQIGNALREQKEDLGMLVSYEMGKSYQEGLGEVQEMIDICDFAVGLSRQLHGFTMHSERPLHRMYDQYHPIGIVGVISAFN
ncbi:MAG: aldehyde dehydrogenase family protein, partial [Sphingobacteriaceae bacterium]